MKKILIILCFIFSYVYNYGQDVIPAPPFNFTGTKVLWHHRPIEVNKVNQVGVIYHLEQLLQYEKPILMDEKVFFLLTGSIHPPEYDNTLICYNHSSGDSLWQRNYNRQFYKYGSNFNRGFRRIGRNLELFGNLAKDTTFFNLRQYYYGFTHYKLIDEFGSDLIEIINLNSKDAVGGLSSNPIHYLEGSDYAFYYIQRGSTNPEFTHSVYPYIWNDTFGVRTNVENIVSFKEPDAQYAWVSGPVQTDALTYVYFFSTYNINANTYKHYTWKTNAIGKYRDLKEVTNIIGSNQRIYDSTLGGYENSNGYIRLKLMADFKPNVKFNSGYLYLDADANIVKDQRNLVIDGKRVGHISSIDLMDHGDILHVIRFIEENNLYFYTEKADGRFLKSGELINQNYHIYAFLPRYILQTPERDIILTLEATLDSLSFGEYFTTGGWPYICKIEAKELSIITDTKSNSRGFEFCISPNPAEDYITIDVPHDVPGMYFEIINSLGQKMIKQSIIVTNNRIPISYLPIGIYELRLFNNDKLLGTEQFIKQ